MALNKRSYQVSTLTDRFGAHGAILANDGSRQTVSGCAHSLNATNPWWAVDLGDPTLVIQVDLTSSGNVAGTDRGFTITVCLNILALGLHACMAYTAAYSGYVRVRRENR